MGIVGKSMKSGKAGFQQSSLVHAQEYLEKISQAITTLTELERLRDLNININATKKSTDTIATMNPIPGIGTISILCNETGPIAAEILEDKDG